jgi:hypothetical protein
MMQTPADATHTTTKMTAVPPTMDRAGVVDSSCQGGFFRAWLEGIDLAKSRQKAH